MMCQIIRATFSISILRFLLEKAGQPDILAYLKNFIFPKNHSRLKYKGWLDRQIKEAAKVAQRVRLLFCNNQRLGSNPQHTQETTTTTTKSP